MTRHGHHDQEPPYSWTVVTLFLLLLAALLVFVMVMR